MQGVNILTVNQSTMLEIINLWLSHEFKSPPFCKRVEWDGKGSGGFILTLEILEDQENANRN